MRSNVAGHSAVAICDSGLRAVGNPQGTLTVRSRPSHTGVVLVYLPNPWPPWPHVHRGDLLAIRQIAPEVPGGRLYWEVQSETGCTSTDCPHARLRREYLIPCDQTEAFAARLESALEVAGSSPPQRLVGEYITGEEWRAGFVRADVTTGKI